MSRFCHLVLAEISSLSAFASRKCECQISSFDMGRHLCNAGMLQETRPDTNDAVSSFHPTKPPRICRSFPIRCYSAVHLTLKLHA